MIVKDGSLFLIFDILKQVRWYLERKNSFRIRMILQVELQQVLVT